MTLFFVYLVVTTVCLVGVGASSKYQKLLAKMKRMEDNGQQFTVDDILNFAKTCIIDHASSEAIDAEYMSGINRGRNLLDVWSFQCTPYTAGNSANATAANLPECLISNVLPGTTVLISDCSSNCVGDQYLRLYDYDTNIELLSNDDGHCEAPLNLCSSFQYTNTLSSTQTLSLIEGCFDNESCGGQVKVVYSTTNSPLASPTFLPTFRPSAAPTGLPTLTPSSSSPTSLPTTSSYAVNVSSTMMQCKYYSTANTNYAKQNTATCVIQNICPGTFLTIGDCDSTTCNGDQYIRLFDSNNHLVMYDDDGCGVDPVSDCSSLSYAYTGTSCQDFYLQQGCYESDSCSGVMSIYYVTTSSPTAALTNTPVVKQNKIVPTNSPSVEPSATPTSHPTTEPTAEPSIFPSSKPSVIPTNEPSSSPSLLPSVLPTTLPSSFLPTPFPTVVPTASPTTTINKSLNCGNTTDDFIIYSIYTECNNYIHIKVLCDSNSTSNLADNYYYYPTYEPTALP